ncbi:hypothetical protein N7582_001934 [Saccharomyces uvarum]|nr:hypothetical protein N7582_001934 [Saccharomyces uvarum]
MIGENYLTFVYNKASGITSEFFKKNFHDGYTCLVNNFDPDTIIKYGRRLGPSIYTFIHAGELLPFSGLELLPHDDLRLLRDSGDPERLLTVLGPLFRDLVMKNTHREYISRWICMAALKYESWEDTSIPCPKKPAHTFRQLMDAVRCFIVFSLLCVVDNIPAATKVLAADEQPRDMFLPWFKGIYIKAANEENTEAHTFITANFVTQSVESHGRYMSFGYIKNGSAQGRSPSYRTVR